MANSDLIAEAIENFTESADARFAKIEDRLDVLGNPRAGGLGRQIEPDAFGDTSQHPRGSGARVIGPVARHLASHGFDTLGHFALAVRDAGIHGGQVDSRLMAAAASTVGNESSGSDGGFLVPETYRATIMEKAFGEDSLIGRTMQIPVAGNALVAPTSMHTAWGTSGIQAYWEAEQAAITQSKPEIQTTTIRLHKLAALIPASDELLEDAAAAGALISRQPAQAIDFKLSYAIAWGTGAGQPLGFMNSAAFVTESAETSQTADTFVAENASKMLARLPTESLMRAVWLVHPSLTAQLPLMVLGTQPVFLPPNGMPGAPLSTLLGRPVIPHQVCETAGDLGDVMLVDLGAYMTAVKRGGLRSQRSSPSTAGKIGGVFPC